MNAPAPAADGEWPSEDLEYLGSCPACGREKRAVMFESVKDLAFGVAPGVWTLWRCAACGAGYIDPRPSESSIGRAYNDYYTHDAVDGANLESLIAGSGLNSRLRAGYYNARHGYRLPNGWPLGAIVPALVPSKTVQWDHLIRHLPPPDVPGAPILDVGCGAGAFLHIARGLGYTPIGLEPDPAAVEVARAAGLDVRLGLLPDTGLPEACFEQITLNHVFEHLHRPVEAAAELLRLLRTGGRIWFSQPNLDAAGLLLFGAYWRGLETPRHLLLLNSKGFVNFLAAAGFVDIELLPPRPEAVGSYRASLSMMEGIIPRENQSSPGWSPDWLERARRADREAARRPSSAESLTLTARKP